MPNKPLRIILDTNLWVSFLITKDYSRLDSILSKSCTLLFSEELLSEFIDVIKRPKLKKYFSSLDVESVFEIIEKHAEYIYVNITSDLCRDPKDNFLLSLAISGKADYLISGDKDLLELKSINKTKIITISNFMGQYER